MKAATVKVLIADLFFLVGVVALATVLGGVLAGAIACIVAGLLYGFSG